MSNPQMEKLKKIFEDALEFAPAAREAFLARACGDDLDLRVRIDRLLLAYQSSEGFLENPLPLVSQALQGDRSEQLLDGRRIGPYLIEREIGRGGMGSVYLAVRADDEYQQQVAIKLVWPGLNHDEIVRRFLQERQILADLNHPGIARLLDGGRNEQGWPYLVMEYIDGVPITGYCDRHQLSVVERLRLFQKVCEVVNFAHGHGIIHRDLKPGNIFVNRDGEIKLLDFGIAKLLRINESDQPISLSQSMLSWMTPEYASPEQLRNEPVTPASDAYSLGVVLSELLTGCKPYRLKRRLPIDVMQAVFEQEPEKPSERLVGEVDLTFNPVEDNLEKLRRRLIGDLDNIVIKALNKDAAQRYQSAAEMSEDISRHLAGRAIEARRPTLTYRAGKLMRRNKGAAIVTGLMLMASLIIGVQLLLQWPERRRIERRRLYAAQVRQAEQDWKAGRLDKFQRTLTAWTSKLGGTNDEDQAGFEQAYLQRLSRRNLAWLGMPSSVSSIGFIAQGRRLFASSADGTCKVWEIETWDERASWKMNLIPTRQLRLSHEMVLGLESTGIVGVWNLTDGKPVRRFVSPSADIREADFFRGVSQVVTAHENGELRFWDIASGRLLQPSRRLANPTNALLFSADGLRMLTITDQGAVELLDSKSLGVIKSFQTQLLHSANFTPNGKGFFIFADQQVILRDSVTGNQLGQCTEKKNTLLAVGMLSNRFLATYSRDGVTNLYEAPELVLKKTFSAHNSAVLRAALSPDSKMLATGGADKTIKLWDVETQQELAVINGHTGDVNHLRFSPDGGQLATGSDDHTVKVWDVAATLDSGVLKSHGGGVYSVAFSPDGAKLVTAGADQKIKLWDVASGQLLATFTGHAGLVLCVAFSPDGHRIASSGDDWTARVWDLETRQSLFTLKHPSQIHSVAFSPDGKLIATGASDKLIRLWDAATGAELRQLKGHTDEVWSVAFSRDGRSIASGSVDHTIKIWDVATGNLTSTLLGHTEPVWSVAFSPDGKNLATCGIDRTARLWDLAAQKVIQTFASHTNEVFEVAFSPDGKRLATAGKDHTIKIWDPVIGQELLTLTDHKDQVWSVAFSPDGKTLASGSSDKTARLWRSMTAPATAKRVK